MNVTFIALRNNQIMAYAESLESLVKVLSTGGHGLLPEPIDPASNGLRIYKIYPNGNGHEFITKERYTETRITWKRSFQT